MHDPSKPKGVKFRCATILPSKDIALELDSYNSVKYLSNPINANRFARQMGPYYRAKTRTYTVIAEFLPTSFNTNTWADIKHLE